MPRNPKIFHRAQHRVIHAAIIVACTLTIAAESPAAHHAVVVGIADYPAGGDRPYAGNDADDFAAALLADPARWTSSDVTVLRDAAATVAGIQAAIDAAKTGTSGDVFVFYFSGRGASAAGQESLDAYDGPLTDTAFTAMLDGIGNETVCVVLEASHAGGMIEASTTADVVALLACGSGEEAVQTDPALLNGTFTYYLVRALRHRALDTNGDGLYSAHEAFASLPSLAQVPVYATTASDDVILRRVWRGRAVVVGIAEYTRTGALSYCDDDAVDIRQTLLLDPVHWDAGDVRLVLNSDATFAAIKTAILAEAEVADVFLFNFSGHGTVDFDPPHESDGVWDDEASDEALCAYDANIRDDHLEYWLSGFRSDEICVVIDTCYSGGMAKSGGLSTAAAWVRGFSSDLVRVTRAARDLDDLDFPGLVALMACADNRTASEDAFLQNGVFTFFVVEALRRVATDVNSDGLVSAEEIFAYAAGRAQSFDPGQAAQIYPAASGDFHVARADDYETFEIARESDLPLGGAGCVSGGSGRGHLAVAALAALAAAALVRRRHAGIVAFLCAGAALGGCLFVPYYGYQYPSWYSYGTQPAQVAQSGAPSTRSAEAPSAAASPERAAAPAADGSSASEGAQATPSPGLGQVAPVAPVAPAQPTQTYYVWTARGFVPVVGTPEHIRAAGLQCYIWTPRGYALATVSAPMPTGGGGVVQGARTVAADAAHAPTAVPSAAAQMGTGPYQGAPARPKLTFGVRVGVSAPVAEQTQSYSGGLASGVFIAGKRETARVEYELGLDRTTASADDVDVTTDVTSLRLDLLFARAEHPADRQPYLSAGARLYVFESTVYWGEATEVAASVGVGLGVRRPGSGWDVRLDVDLLLETENVRSLVHARCAYRF